MEERKAEESSDAKEPVYCTIAEKKENPYCDAVAGESKGHYQQLNTANGRPNHLYARVNNPDHSYDVGLDQSVV